LLPINALVLTGLATFRVDSLDPENFKYEIVPAGVTAEIVAD